MRRNNKSSRGLTRDERTFCMLQSIDGTQQVIDECWKVIKNPKETGDRKMALQVALEGTKNKLEMLKKVGELHANAAVVNVSPAMDQCLRNEVMAYGLLTSSGSPVLKTLNDTIAIIEEKCLQK